MTIEHEETVRDVDVIRPAASSTPRARPTPPRVAHHERGRVTFQGNSYDLTSLGAVGIGVLMLLMCLTCNQISLCLPCLPLVLGIIGLAMAKDAVDEARTRTLSWIGIGSTALVVLLGTLAVVGYFAFLFFIIVVSQGNY